MQIGIRGYVHKEAPDFQIMEAVNHVLDKGYYTRNLDAGVVEPAHSQNPFDRLSPREMEVARHVVKGESLKMIAYKLNLQVSTISTFKLRILEKLEIDSTLELARIYDQFCPE
jgi:DNA-binding NarL/FixJ family response regulator